MKSKHCLFVLLTLAAAVNFLGAVSAIAQIQVNSTTPSAAPQGTVNLNGTVNCSGFKKGAKAQWFVTGTTNPGGVTVNSTTFNGSSSLTASITIASGAVISGYDVRVTNADGRTGKGTDLFAVTQQGTPTGCSTTGTPGGFTLQAVLNPVQQSGAALVTTLILGEAIRVQPLDLKRDGVVDTLVAFVTSGSNNGSIPGTYVFFLDPATGQPQATNPATGAAWQNPLQVLTGVQSRHAAAGDVNGDGIPDFVLASPADSVAYLFGGAVAIGNVTGGAGNGLAVGADNGGTNGLVYVFPYPASQSNYFTLSGPGPGFGEGVGIADVNLDGFPDLVVNAGGSKAGQTLVFPGNVHAGSSYTNQLLPATGLSNNWALPDFAVGNLQSVGGVAVGTPNASNSNGCPISVGALQLFTSPYASSQQPNYVFEPPSLVGSKQFEYGYSVSFVPGYPIMLVGEHYRDVGTTSMAGQVYVYKRN